MSRPTSAALSVLNFKTTPDSGSKVFKVKVARGTLAASSFSSAALSRLRFFGFWYFGESRFGRLYFVVMRVYVTSRQWSCNHLLCECPHVPWLVALAGAARSSVAILGSFPG